MNQQKADQLAERLLKSPAGREILGKKLSLKIESQGTETLPIVAILVPCYDTPTAEMANALALMMDAAKGKAIVYTGPVIRDSSVVHWARNMLISELIKTQRPWTHVLFIDDDIVPPSDAIPRLLAHKKDIVAGVCTKRTDPPTPNMRWFDEEELVYREVFDWPQDKLITVGAVGTGFMLITRHALEQVADAYFNCKYEIERFGLSDDRVEKLRASRLEHFDKYANGFWFRFLEGLKGCNEYGEDISFCLMASRYCKIPVYVDTSIKPGHIGRYPYSVEDFLFQRDAAIAQAKADGRYKEPLAKGA